MDLSKLKSKLANLQQTDKPTKEKKDYSLTNYIPQVGKQQIRIVPRKGFPDDPFQEVKFYYDIHNKVMISPENFGEKDPIALFIEALRAEYTKQNYFLAKKLESKTRTFVQVIVRGEEEKGVRLWAFGKQIYEELLSLMLDDEVGDFTDIVNGRDFTVETIDKSVTGTGFNKTNVRPKMATSPLSKDAKLVKEWTTKQIDPLTEYTRYSFDDMKSALEKYLTPGEDDEKGEVVKAEELDNSPKTSTPNKPYALEVKGKKSKVDEFDTMFAKSDEDEEDDLPF
jgi:hypothetical protein